MQVKRPIKINKYDLKSLQDTYSKNTREGATQKQRTSKQKKKRYKSVCNLFRDSAHPDPASCDSNIKKLQKPKPNKYIQRKFSVKVALK